MMDDLWQAGLGGVGIATSQTANHENPGQYKYPVQPSRGYRTFDFN
jgi:hypothetical protein